MKSDVTLLSFADEQKLLERKNQFFLDLAKSVAPGKASSQGRRASPKPRTRGAKSSQKTG